MNKKKGSVVNIIEGIIIGVLILLIAAMLILYFAFSKSGAAPSIFGSTFYHTMATNMQPEIPENTVVIGKKSAIPDIKPGSVVICKIGEDTVITRVVEILNEAEGTSYVVKFQTAPPNDTFKIPRENVIAKAVTQSRLMGSILSFATSTVGIMTVIIIPSFVIIVIQIIRIVNAKRAEEYAVSLDDLDEIMTDEDDDPADVGREFFSEPASFSTESFSDSEDLSPVNRRPEPKATVLSVDKNGKAGLTAVPDENAPLFSYGSSEETSLRAKVPEPRDTGSFYSTFAESSDNTDGGEYEEKEESPSGFMSNILPESITRAAEMSESPLSSEEPAKTYEPKPVRDDRRVSVVKAIPEQAVVPREKLAPPKKVSTGKAISELMSIIDAEESKLKK